MNKVKAEINGRRGESPAVGTGMKPVTVAYQKATPDRFVCVAPARNLPA